MKKEHQSGLALIDRAEKYGQRTAIISDEGSYSYQKLLEDSAKVASGLLQDCSDLEESRVAFLEPPGYSYAAVQWGIWRSGGIAVPLSSHHPLPELEYMIENSGAGILVTHPSYENRLRPIAEKNGCRLLCLQKRFKINPVNSPKSIPTGGR